MTTLFIFWLLIAILFHYQGGLIGLAAATVGLASEAAQHLEVVSPSSTCEAYKYGIFA